MSKPSPIGVDGLRGAQIRLAGKDNEELGFFTHRHLIKQPGRHFALQQALFFRGSRTDRKAGGNQRRQQNRNRQQDRQQLETLDFHSA